LILQPFLKLGRHLPELGDGRLPRGGEPGPAAVLASEGPGHQFFPGQTIHVRHQGSGMAVSHLHGPGRRSDGAGLPDVLYQHHPAPAQEGFPLLFNPEATFDLSLLRLGAFGQDGPAAEIKSLAFHGGIFKKE
jgi:hypothetical protein